MTTGVLATVVGAALWACARALLRNSPQRSVLVRSADDRVVGTRAVVVDLKTADSAGAGTGLVRTSGELWRARFEGERPQAGESVWVTERDGLVLRCTRGEPPDVARLGQLAAISTSERWRDRALGIFFGSFALVVGLILAGETAFEPPYLVALLGSLAAPFLLTAVRVPPPGDGGRCRWPTLRSTRDVLAVTFGMSVSIWIVGSSAGSAGFAIATLVLIGADPWWRDLFLWGTGGDA